MKNKNWRAGLACLVLAVVTVTGVAGATANTGAQGSEADPLVTLSYVTAVMEELKRQLGESLTAKVNGLGDELKAGSQAVFATVEVPAGKTVTLVSGAQLILRTGAASDQDDLTDLTDGVILWDALKANHLYIATRESHVITVTEDAVFLIQGSYSVE